jgi:hypothetical protein
MSDEVNYDRVAEVLVLVALRLTMHDDAKKEGEHDVDTGVLPRID